MKEEEKKKKVELNDEELDNVAGGVIRKPADTTQTES